MFKRSEGEVLLTQLGSVASTTHEKPETCAAGAAPEQAPTSRPANSEGAVREIVESIVIALLLAFLIRTFEAEPFVIPTGSMATTLMGRHKDVVCEKCGFPYQISASEEVNPETNKPTNVHVVAGTCPNCRYTMLVGEDQQGHESHSSYKGDRILVGKFAYDFAEPQRWDVAVFKWPGGAETNYIKRLVGLPEETLKISHGDIFVKPVGQETFTIARKPPEKVEAILRPVYDNDYVVSDLIKRGWPARWAPAPGDNETAGQWQTSGDLRSFCTDGSAKETVWLRYQHRVPSFEDWEHLEHGGTFDPEAIRPQLISDFTGYNTNVNDEAAFLGPTGRALGLHWVGDLAIEGTLEVERPSGQALFELIKGGYRFRCQIDVATGAASLSIDGLQGYQPTAQTGVCRAGCYGIRFANVDQQLFLWVNGRSVRFDQETAYPSLDNRVPTRADLEPVRVGSRGAALRIRHLRLLRDLYYIAVRPGVYGSAGEPMADYALPASSYPLQPQRVAQFLSNPEEWHVFGRSREVEFKLDKDQFLMLGDNSAESSDSRLWEQRGFEPYVSRELLIGKALCIYWPHPWECIPGTSIWFPMFPNYSRMGFIR